MTALQDEIRALREQVDLHVVANQGPPGLDLSWASALCPTPAVRSAPGFRQLVRVALTASCHAGWYALIGVCQLWAIRDGVNGWVGMTSMRTTGS